MDDHSENIVPRTPWQLPVSQTGDSQYPGCFQPLWWRLVWMLGMEEGLRWGKASVLCPPIS